MIGKNLGLCPYPVGIMEQEQRYLELLPNVRTVIEYMGISLSSIPKTATVLLFQAE